MIQTTKTLSVFRRQKYLICNSTCEKHFTIAFGDFTDFSDADKRLCAAHPRANVFLRTGVGKLRVLSITDVLRCIMVQNARASSGNEKVMLSSASSIAFERSSHSNDQCAPRIEKNTSGPRFSKQDFETKFLES